MKKLLCITIVLAVAAVAVGCQRSVSDEVWEFETYLDDFLWEVRGTASSRAKTSGGYDEEEALAIIYCFIEGENDITYSQAVNAYNYLNAFCTKALPSELRTLENLYEKAY